MGRRRECVYPALGLRPSWFECLFSSCCFLCSNNTLIRQRLSPADVWRVFSGHMVQNGKRIRFHFKWIHDYGLFVPHREERRTGTRTGDGGAAQPKRARRPAPQARLHGRSASAGGHGRTEGHGEVKRRTGANGGTKIATPPHPVCRFHLNLQKKGQARRRKGSPSGAVRCHEGALTAAWIVSPPVLQFSWRCALLPSVF